jgi:hypothetical protein
MNASYQEVHSMTSPLRSEQIANTQSLLLSEPELELQSFLQKYIVMPL